MDTAGNLLWWKLPADIQSEILIRLPGETLISLKLISWEWFNLISSLCIPRLSPPSPTASFSGFIYRERDLGPGPYLSGTSNLSLAMLHDEEAQFSISYKSVLRLSKHPGTEDVQDCCNGVLLMVHHRNDDVHVDVGVRYSLYNPTTHQIIQVPPPPHNYQSHSNCFASLAFDPTNSLHYQIISTPGLIITNPLKLETFSSETAKWSTYVVDIDSKLHGLEWLNGSAYLDGRIYRLLKPDYLVCIHRMKTSQIFTVQAIRLPNICSDGSIIGISRNRLHYSTRHSNGSSMLVYMLMDDDGWLLKHNLSLDDLLSKQCDWFCRVYKRALIHHHKTPWFNFYFHPNTDHLFLVTPLLILEYSPENKLLEIPHMKVSGQEILMGQNYSFPYSYCPVILQSALKKTSRLNLDQHDREISDQDSQTMETEIDVANEVKVPKEDITAGSGRKGESDSPKEINAQDVPIGAKPSEDIVAGSDSKGESAATKEINAQDVPADAKPSEDIIGGLDSKGESAATKEINAQDVPTDAKPSGDIITGSDSRGESAATKEINAQGVPVAVKPSKGMIAG